MSDNPLRTELNSLERKLILLLSNYQKQKQEIAQLQGEIGHLKGQLSDKEHQLASFQNKDKISKLVDGMVAGEGNPEQLGNMLDEYIKEIDKCIAQLSE